MLNLSNLNPCVKEMQYAVRGPIVVRAGELDKQIKKVTACFGILLCKYCCLPVMRAGNRDESEPVITERRLSGVIMLYYVIML